MGFTPFAVLEFFRFLIDKDWGVMNESTTITWPITIDIIQIIVQFLGDV